VLPRPIWIEPEPLPSHLPDLAGNPLVSALLWRMGVRDRASAADFLSTNMRPSPDPQLLPNLDRAAHRVTTALATGERIGIFGDYDVDGITATALLLTAFQPAQREMEQVIARLPRRDEGYGLNLAALDEFEEAGVSLLIAVDCGSSDHIHVAAAQDRGMDVVILDHHLLSESVPDGAIVVSARLDPDCPYQTCCSAALAYLFTSALAQHGVPVDGGEGRPETALLDFVALGTIGDVCPLTGVNRDFVRDGVRLMQRSPRPGLRALCAVAGIAPADLTSEAIPFRITPRINAAGRLGDPRIALDLLLATDDGEAALLANEIELINNRRKVIGEQIANEAETQLQTDAGWASRPCFVLHDEAWHAGVVGIVAGKLANRYGRPVIVLSDDGFSGRGSARSVPGFNIVEALETRRDLFDHFGGHSQAAGMSIPLGMIETLRQTLESAIIATGLEIPAPPSIAIAADIRSDQLTLATANAIERLQPFGTGNERPILRLSNVVVQDQLIMGQDRSHLRLSLATPGEGIKAVFWSAAHRAAEARPGTRIDVAGTLLRDTWKGRDQLRLELKDFRVS
jgi:single-stranded-DNA-specific exonuclease